MRKKIIVFLAVFLLLASRSTFAQEVSQADAQRFSAYYSNGMNYLKNQQYSSAINEFKKVLRFSPYDSTIQNALAATYLARAQYYRTTTKEIKKSLIDYKSAYFYAKYWSNSEPSGSMAQLANTCLRSIQDFENRLQLTSTALRLQSAKTLRVQGEFAASAYDYQQLIKGSYQETAYENLANIYKNLNNLMMAMDYIKTAIDINPKNAKLHFLYGVMLDEAKNYEASMEQYNLALQYGDKSPELMEILENKWTQNIVNNPSAQNHINLGAIYQKQGNLEAAKAQYLKAIAMNPNDDTASLNLASLYIQQKNYNGAIETYNNLLSKKPNDKEILKYKANALYSAQRFDEALGVYDNLSKIDPNDTSIQNSINDIVYNHFQGQKLQNYLILKANAAPNSYEAQFNCALEFHKNKNYNGALTYYQKAIAANPSKEEAYINLAQIYLEQKNYKKAEEICQKGLMLLPNSASLNQYLTDAKSYSMNNQFDEATKLYEARQFESALNKYMQIPNKTQEVNMAIASCYWELNDYKNANKYYQNVLSQNPKNLDALTNSAYAYFSMNDYTNAKTLAQKALAIDSSNKEALEIISSINQTQITSLYDEASGKYEAGDYKGSIDTLKKMLSQKPSEEYTQFAYYYLALDYDNLEKYKDALSYYEKFLSAKGNAQDEMTSFAASRSKELKDYLGQLNAK